MKIDGAAVTPGCGCWPVPGVVAPMNSAAGIQGCDDCATFGDLEAAALLAAKVGGVVWFYTPTDDPSLCEWHAHDLDDPDECGAAAQWAGPDDARLILTGTDPWVEVDDDVVEWDAPEGLV